MHHFSAVYRSTVNVNVCDLYQSLMHGMDDTRKLRIGTIVYFMRTIHCNAWYDKFFLFFGITIESVWKKWAKNDLLYTDNTISISTKTCHVGKYTLPIAVLSPIHEFVLRPSIFRSSKIDFHLLPNRIPSEDSHSPWNLSVAAVCPATIMFRATCRLYEKTTHKANVRA